MRRKSVIGLALGLLTFSSVALAEGEILDRKAAASRVDDFSKELCGKVGAVDPRAKEFCETEASDYRKTHRVPCHPDLLRFYELDLAQSLCEAWPRFSDSLPPYKNEGVARQRQGAWSGYQASLRSNCYHNAAYTLGGPRVGPDHAGFIQAEKEAAEVKKRLIFTSALNSTGDRLSRDGCRIIKSVESQKKPELPQEAPSVKHPPAPTVQPKAGKL